MSEMNHVITKNANVILIVGPAVSKSPSIVVPSDGRVCCAFVQHSQSGERAGSSSSLASATWHTREWFLAGPTPGDRR